ncbi:MAG: hypothetical protein JWR78_1780 [Mycobacterium sp.]|nr:hypothetical protein [Mycobacterium sp.]
MTTTTELVDRYFALAPQADTGPYFAQFAEDATAEDEGVSYHGIEAIRAWRTSVPPVSYEVLDVQKIGDEQVARAEISGDFPGSPVVLRFHFTFTDDGLVESLAIRSRLPPASEP